MTQGAALALLLAGAAATQAPSHSQGQVALYSLKQEREAEFAEGYLRHLGWHLKNADPWAWYVWAIVVGERRGQYVGGSFDHPWTDLDRRPHPAEDRADHAVNIDPHLERASSRMVERREDLGGELPLLETAPRLAAFELGVRPGARAAFEGALRDLSRLRAGSQPRGYGWFEVLNGDHVPDYLLLVPLDGLAELRRVRHERLGSRDEERGAAREAVERALLAVESVRSEVWSFRADLSTCALPKSGCVGVVPKPAERGGSMPP